MPPVPGGSATTLPGDIPPLPKGLAPLPGGLVTSYNMPSQQTNGFASLFLGNTTIKSKSTAVKSEGDDKEKESSASENKQGDNDSANLNLHRVSSADGKDLLRSQKVPQPYSESRYDERSVT